MKRNIKNILKEASFSPETKFFLIAFIIMIILIVYLDVFIEERDFSPHDIIVELHGFLYDIILFGFLFIPMSEVIYLLLGFCLSFIRVLI